MLVLLTVLVAWNRVVFRAVRQRPLVRALSFRTDASLAPEIRLRLSI